MKKIFIFLALNFLSASIFAQETSSGFNGNKMFAGGSLVLGYAGGSTSQFTIGANPEIGYSLAKNFDLGICFNTIYSSLRYFDAGYNVKQNNFNYGFGLFTRFHFSDNIFIQLQPEINTIKYKQTVDQNPSYLNEGKLNSTSFLAGIGYGTRSVGDFNFFTVILVDLRKELYSPYRSNNGDLIPVIRGGFNIYFGKKKNK